jgi:hypothetical protein
MTNPRVPEEFAKEIASLFGEYGFDVDPATVRDALAEIADRAGQPDRVRRDIGLPATPDPDSDSDPDPDCEDAPASGAADRSESESSGSGRSGSGSVALAYRVETRTPTGVWVTVQTGTTPPIWRPTPTLFDSVARTILTNLRPILGLGSADPVPTARARTWHPDLAGFASSRRTRPMAHRWNRLLTRIRDVRLWLAERLAPAGVDLHEHDTSECLSRIAVLEAACFGDLRPHDHHVWAPVDIAVADAVEAGLLERTTVHGQQELWLTKVGESELAAHWGPGRVPPGKGGLYGCWEHGEYIAAPGDPDNCPRCPRPAPSRGVLSIRPRVA